MRKHQQDLIQLITQLNSNLSLNASNFIKTDVQDLAYAFVDITFLSTALQFIQEQYWIQSNEDRHKEIIFSMFVKKFFKAELSPILFFHKTLEDSSIEQVQIFKDNVSMLQKIVVTHASTLLPAQKKEFAKIALKQISELFEFEYQLVMDKNSKNQTVRFSLYRTFDSLDIFFNLDYKEDLVESSPAANQARLYEGSGAAVQSSYATLLLALRYLKLPQGSQFIDLGSGFGRVGLVVGVLRPDVIFTGYEFVPQRVEVATNASKSLDMNSHVRFYAQDLAATDFSIPEADTYYLYDPFNESTYKSVIAQLNAIGAKRKITVITKGNAKAHFQEASQRSFWSRPQEFEHGNFCLFRSNSTR